MRKSIPYLTAALVFFSGGDLEKLFDVVKNSKGSLIELFELIGPESANAEKYYYAKDSHQRNYLTLNIGAKERITRFKYLRPSTQGIDSSMIMSLGRGEQSSNVQYTTKAFNNMVGKGLDDVFAKMRLGSQGRDSHVIKGIGRGEYSSNLNDVKNCYNNMVSRGLDSSFVSMRMSTQGIDSQIIKDIGNGRYDHLIRTIKNAIGMFAF